MIDFKGLKKFIETGKVKDIDEGLCKNFQLTTTEGLWEGILRDEVREAFKKWPEFSGSTAYPVPATECHGAHSCINQYYDHPKYSGKQLALRISLAKHLIKELT